MAFKEPSVMREILREELRLPEFTYFVDRMTWASLGSDKLKLEVLKRLYHGRGGLKTSWWDSETTKSEDQWTPPITEVGVNTRETAPWNNAIHLRNSRDGVNIDQIYLTPNIKASNRLVMRLDMKCPTLANLPADAGNIVIGFEVSGQGGTTIAALLIQKTQVTIVGRYLKADGTTQVLQSSDISSWVATGTWKEFRFILDPPRFRLVDAATPSNYAELYFADVGFFPKVVPFFANECSTVVVSGIYIGQFAVWHLPPKTLNTLKGSVFNTSVTANTNIFTSDLTPSRTPTTFRIYACFSTSGVLTVKRTKAGTTVSEQLNGGYSLNPNAAYVFDIIVESGESINLQYSVSATAVKLGVYEVEEMVS